MTLKSALLTLLLSLAFKFSFTQVPLDISNKFFAVYKQGDTDKALDFLFSNSPYAKDIQDGIDDVKRKLKKHVDQIGKYYGYDLLVKRTAGPNLILVTFLVRHDREPMTFQMLYYKPNDKWQMQNFKYSNSTDEELEEASKAYRLKENYE